MQTRAQKRRQVARDEAFRDASAWSCTSWGSVDPALLAYIVAQGGFSRSEALRLAGVCTSWRKAIWAELTACTVVTRLEALQIEDPPPPDETGFLAWVGSRLRAAPRLRALRVCCSYNLVGEVMAAAAAAGADLETLELSFYTGDGPQGHLPAAALLTLPRLPRLTALCMGSSSEPPQPALALLSQLVQLTRLEMPYLQVSHATAAALGRLTRLRHLWLELPSGAALASLGRALTQLTSLRVDMRAEVDDEGFAVPLSPPVLASLPRGLRALHVTGATFRLASFPWEALPNLTTLGCHDRVLEDSLPEDVTAAADRLECLAIFLSSVGFYQLAPEAPAGGGGGGGGEQGGGGGGEPGGGDPAAGAGVAAGAAAAAGEGAAAAAAAAGPIEDIALDSALDLFAWLPTLRALRRVRSLWLNPMAAGNRFFLPALYVCTLGLPHITHLHLYNITDESDAHDALYMAARRWRDSLTHLTLHCCEGATPSSLECLKAAAGAALQSVELRCCCLATGELAAGAWGPRGRERPAPAARALIADWWSDD